MQNYIATLIDRTGKAWNEFWFRPRDPFVLGLIRILTGAVALYWYLSYIPDLQRFFGPNGLLPASSVDTYRYGRGFSYFDYLQSSSALWIGYVLGLIPLVMFTIGLFSRVTAVLSWIAVLSLIQRGPMLSIGLVDLLAMLLLYLLIGPTGASLSVDNLLRRRKAVREGKLAEYEAAAARKSWTANVSLRLIQVHLAAAYFLMAIAKMKVDSWWGGTAIYWISANDPVRLVDLTWMARGLYNNYLMNAWTNSIMFFELAFALLIWNRLLRPLLLALAVPVWIGTAMVTDAYAFSFLILTANLVYFSSSGLRAFFSRRAAATSGTVATKSAAKTAAAH